MDATFQERVKVPQLAVKGLPTAKIAEILAIMKFEIEFHKDELTPEQVALLQVTAKKLVNASGVHVPKVSAFYIPSVDVDVVEDCDKVWNTRGCEVMRGVYDQETRLIAQYLTADNRYARQLFWSATEIWHGFHHPNVAKMTGESLVEARPVVIWEDAATHGNFIHYFASEDESSQRRLWRMFLQVAHGLNYIHQQGKAHGNLKCSHILVAKDGTPKICHFELSKGPHVGAFDRWKGPEYNLGTGVDPSAAGDVFSYGLCIIEARTGYIPYELDCDDTVKQQLEECDCYPRPGGMRDDEWDVVQRFVVYKPENRPTMAQAIEMVEALAWKEALEEEQIGFGLVKTA
ncbi:hypothetical protein ON010_g11203 [Phytophthora cinnamomi]|nr:hypothetical protein ON010_g11203 [Phytophthora cinnamomi]